MIIILFLQQEFDDFLKLVNEYNLSCNTYLLDTRSYTVILYFLTVISFIFLWMRENQLKYHGNNHWNKLVMFSKWEQIVMRRLLEKTTVSFKYL